jgi:hypothetical protein
MPKRDLISITAKKPKMVCMLVGVLFIAAGIADLMTGTFISWTLWRFVPCLIYFLIGTLSILHSIFRKSD